ncbi:hypothetical protein WN944_009395 [Citrus x changshan-huyou]|uniref:Uncharacterized protein n=1 Tax=Citrus x changshan-huyou TaxID=2935761 RepID=A0AAP0MS26_9ROSI
MESKDHASVDVEKLAESLSGKFKAMRYPSSESICIYRVPQHAVFPSK